MKPYYQDDAVTIYHGDCLDVIPTLDAFGAVFTSPPYNLCEGGRNPSGSDWSELKAGYASYSDDLPRPEYLAWQQTVLLALWAGLTVDGAIFYQHKPLARGNAITDPRECVPSEIPIRQVITWDRGDSGVQRSFWHLCPSYEWIFVLAREGFRYNTLSVGDVWRVRPDGSDLHPASFPLQLPTRAIGTTDARTVLDPFMGSGTTLRAAKDLGRRAIGIEIEERYCEIAAKRMAQEVLAF